MYAKIVYLNGAFQPAQRFALFFWALSRFFNPQVCSLENNSPEYYTLGYLLKSPFQ